MKNKAEQIVAAMLEDYAGDYEERPGGKKDMWRQGGYSKFSLLGKDFGGKRPNDTTKPVSDEEEDEKQSAASASPAVKAKSADSTPSRFKWKPNA